MIEDLFTPVHLLILFAILFFLFGAKRLPDLGKSLGHGIREFRGGIAGLSDAPVDEQLPAAPAEEPPAEPLAIAAPAADTELATVAEGDEETIAHGGDETIAPADAEPISPAESEIIAPGDGESAVATVESERAAS